MKFVVVALFIIGYLTVGAWVYRRYFLQLEQRKRRVYAGAVTACGLLLAGGSIYAALPSALDVPELLRKVSSSWEKELLGLNVAGGGLRFSRVDHSVEPDVWSTAQSLMAVMVRRQMPLSETDAKQIREHLNFIDRVRLPQAEGWGYKGFHDWGVTEIAAWVVLAYLGSMQPDIVNAVWGGDAEIAFKRVAQYLRLLQRRQLTNGGWAPISQNDNIRFARTYSTTMALWAFIEAKKHPEIRKRIDTKYDDAIKGGIRWLLAKYDGRLESWVPNPERERQRKLSRTYRSSALRVRKKPSGIQFFA